MSDFNPIQYTSRTFLTILNDMNNDPELADKPNWSKRAMAGIGDVASMWNNAQANNTYLETSFTRRAAALLLQLIDYYLAPRETSSGILLFYLDPGVTFPVTIAESDLVGILPGSLSISQKRFEARAGVTQSLETDTFTDAEVNTGTDEITVTRVFTTGEKIQLTTTGTLPIPLAIDTNYYVIKISDTVIQLAESLDNAYAGTAIDITAAGSGTNTITMYSVQVTVYQQTRRNSIDLGDSDGVTEFQEFLIPDENILFDTVEILINSVPWTQVETLVESGPADTVYRLFQNENESAVVQFGNGTLGAIPGAFPVIANYAVGGGADSNVSSANRINVYGGADSNVTSVSNPAALTGGANNQSITEAKILGPALLKARNRFVTGPDGEALALSFEGIAQATIIENAFGVLSAQVLCIANGGGNPSPAVQADLEQYLIDRTTLESIDVKVQDTTITPTDVTSAGKVQSGFQWSGFVEEYFRLGWKLFLTEAGNEIKIDYIENGLDSAIVLINSILGESFSSGDTNIINLLENLNPREIGETIFESDVYGYLDNNVVGLAYLTITAPVFPIINAQDEITTPGVLTLTEIT